MVKAIIVEGARGTYKSTVTRLLRNRIEGSTLINLTGFKEDGEDGLKKIVNYYDSLFKYIENLRGDQTLIFDRIFFTEQVMSTLYKKYDFTTNYHHLCDKLMTSFDELELFYFTIQDTKELSTRLNRNKLPLFGHIPENVTETMKQQSLYDEMFSDFNLSYMKLFPSKDTSLMKIDTTQKSSQEIVDMIIPF